ncbi:hypothetical protein DPMN_049671 [Dreissena polymorpha]|uniref:Uncharacterized protein n=1 Tax=Dreissena polymorpha TaxID=45954 RepID=A0A9D4CGC0_DREPO|nr:hypothetical protein DPMN_049671 [Dreissena polymorpha]
MSQPTADSPNIISQPGPRKRSKLNQDDMAFLLGGYFQATTSATPSNGAEELERYLCDEAVSLSQSLFLWWKLNMDTYPRLAVLARPLSQQLPYYRSECFPLLELPLLSLGRP